MLSFLFKKTPLLFFVQSFWRDEAFSYLLAKKNIVEIVLLTAKDYNPPGYYLLLHLWIKFFGSSEIALRSLSLLFFWGVIYVVFLFFSQIFKFRLKKSFLYLLLIVINPLLVYYAFEARMYTMLAFFATLSFYAFYKKKALLYLLSSSLGLYTHYFMIFVLLGQFIYAVKYEKKDRLSSLRYIFFNGLIFLPWLIFVLKSKQELSQSFWIGKPSISAVVNLLGIIYLGHEAPLYAPRVNLLKAVVFFVNLILATLFIYFSISLKKKLKKVDCQLIFFLTIWGAFIPVTIGLISFIKPIYLPRYLIFSTVGLSILVVFLINKLSLTWRNIVVILLLTLTLIYQAGQLSSRQKANLSVTIKEIRLLAKPTDRLYVTSELDFMVAQYYFSENRVFIYGKTYQKIPNYVGKILISPEKVINSLPVYPAKAFIINQNGSYDIKAIY